MVMPRPAARAVRFGPRPLTRRHLGISALLGACFLAINLVALDRTPSINRDEVMLNEPAKELALHGRLRSTVFAGAQGFDRAYFWQPPGQVLVEAACYKVLGFGIVQTRLPSVLFGAGVAALVYLVTIQLFGSSLAALIAAIVFSLDPLFIYVARLGRMDTQCLFFSLLGVSFCLRALKQARPTSPESGIGNRESGIGSPDSRSDIRDSRFVPWFVPAGLAIGLAGITHPVAVSWAIALGALILMQQRSRRPATLAVFGASCALPALIWVGSALPSLHLFAQQFLPHGQEHFAQGSLPFRFLHELARYSSSYRSAPLIPLTYAAAIIFAALSRDLAAQSRASLLLLLVITFVFNALVMAKGNVGMYFLHPNLLMAVATGVMCAAGLGLSPFSSARYSPVTRRHGDSETRRSPRPRVSASPRLLPAAVIALLVLIIGNDLVSGIGGRLVVAAQQWRDRDYSRISNEIVRIIPRGSSVLGPSQVWFAAERAGVSLTIVGGPDAEKYDFAIVSHDFPEPMLAGFRRVAEIGRPATGAHRSSFIVHLSSFVPPFEDYWMTIWQSTVLHPHTADSVRNVKGP